MLWHLKVAFICTPPSLNGHLDEWWIPSFVVIFLLSASVARWNREEGKLESDFFQDPGRVLTQVPLVTVQRPANYCTEDRGGTYSLHLLCCGPSLMPSSLICWSNISQNITISSLEKESPSDVVTRTRILVNLSSVFENSGCLQVELQRFFIHVRCCAITLSLTPVYLKQSIDHTGFAPDFIDTCSAGALLCCFCAYGIRLEWKTFTSSVFAQQMCPSGSFQSEPLQMHAWKRARVH